MERGEKKINISENNIISVKACQGSKCNFLSFFFKKKIPKPKTKENFILIFLFWSIYLICGFS